MDTSLKSKIEGYIEGNNVMLFMKGEKAQPMCGFSAQVVHILNQLGTEYETFNVLADQDIRQGIKEFSDWPTIPQLYVKGSFIGGCDIVTEMFQSGELKTLLEN